MNGTAARIDDLLQLQLEGDTLVVSPTRSMPEGLFQEIETAAKVALQFFLNSRARNVVMDLGRMAYSGSSGLALFVRLWKAVLGRTGKMVLCNVSADEEEILRVTCLDRLWPVYASRASALKAM